MPKFKIIQDNPQKFKSQILNFWKEYLPGTPLARLDWMENNPAGHAIWLFAIEEKTGRLAGTISLFPKDLFLNGKKIKAAILGDFMLHEKFRVFGPALSLLKAAKAFKEKGEFDFLYTIPNLKSKKLVERVGFISAGKCYSLMHPQKLDFLIKKYVGYFFAKILEKPLLLTLRLFSRATYAGFPGVLEGIDWHDDKAFNEFFRQVSKRHIGLMTGDYSLAYLNWRYRQNPEFDFQVLKEKLIPVARAFDLTEDESDYYELLGVSRDADPDEIKKTFRKKVIEVHPDTGDQISDSGREFINLQTAYQTLCDPFLRQQYNANLHDENLWKEKANHIHGLHRLNPRNSRKINQNKSAKNKIVYQLGGLFLFLIIAVFIFDFLYQQNSSF